jgi:hypothetical protein
MARYRTPGQGGSYIRGFKFSRLSPLWSREEKKAGGRPHGVKIIRIVFDKKRDLRSIKLEFSETENERTQDSLFAGRMAPSVKSFASNGPSAR